MNDSEYNFVAIKLCAVLGAVFLLQVLTGFDPGYNASSSPSWKFFTSILGHSDLEHLFNNLFFIGLFGSIYELLTSGKTFTATFLGAAIFANISAFFFFPESSIIGASGGGMGILAALAIYRPWRIGLALGVPVPMWAALLIYVFINVAGLSGATSVAYEAHLFGLLAGSLAGLYLRDQPYKWGESSPDEAEEFDNWRSRIREWEEKWMDI